MNLKKPLTIAIPAVLGVLAAFWFWSTSQQSNDVVVKLTSGSPTSLASKNLSVDEAKGKTNAKSDHNGRTLSSQPKNQIYGKTAHPVDASVIWTNARNALFEVTNPSDNVTRGIYTNFEAPYALQVDDFFGYSILYIDGNEVRWRKVDKQVGSDNETLLATLKEGKLHGLGYDEETSRLYIGDEFGRAAYALAWPPSIDGVEVTRLPVSGKP